MHMHGFASCGSRSESIVDDGAVANGHTPDSICRGCPGFGFVARKSSWESRMVLAWAASGLVQETVWQLRWCRRALPRGRTWKVDRRSHARKVAVASRNGLAARQRLGDKPSRLAAQPWTLAPRRCGRRKTSCSITCVCNHPPFDSTKSVRFRRHWRLRPYLTRRPVTLWRQARSGAAEGGRRPQYRAMRPHLPKRGSRFDDLPDRVIRSLLTIVCDVANHCRHALTPSLGPRYS